MGNVYIGDYVRIIFQPLRIPFEGRQSCRLGLG